MCFIVENNKPKIAKRNIKVYKFVDEIDSTTCESYWKNYKYTQNKVCKKIKLKFTKSKFFGNTIEKGYHSYIYNDDYHIRVNSIFIIPKGSEYYVNIEDGEYVSDTIIFKKYLNDSWNV